MTSTVRWPRPPYRLAKSVAFTPYLLAGMSGVLGLAGAALIVSAGFMVFAWDPDRASTFADRWLPTAVILGVGVGLVWTAYGVFRGVGGRKQVAAGGATGQIVEADVLFSESFSRGGTYWVYAYSQGGRRYYDRRTGLDSRIPGGAPLFLDDVRTRGAVLLVDGAGELILGKLQPLLLDKAEREPVERDVAARAAVPTAISFGGLSVLEVQTPAGPARDFVHFFREACAAQGRQRDKMIDKRDAAARRLKPEEVDDLLRDCREHARTV